MNAGGHGSDVAGCLLRYTWVDLLRDGGGHRRCFPPALCLPIVVGRGVAGGGGGRVRGQPRRRRGGTGRDRGHRPLAAGASAGRFQCRIGLHQSAGRLGRALIEEAGLKGFRLGTAHVSEKHANFIQADKGGRADDVRALMEHVRPRCSSSSGVTLRPRSASWASRRGRLATWEQRWGAVCESHHHRVPPDPDRAATSARRHGSTHFGPAHRGHPAAGSPPPAARGDRRGRRGRASSSGGACCTRRCSRPGRSPWWGRRTRRRRRSRRPPVCPATHRCSTSRPARRGQRHRASALGPIGLGQRALARRGAGRRVRAGAAAGHGARPQGEWAELDARRAGSRCRRHPPARAHRGRGAASRRERPEACWGPRISSDSGSPPPCPRPFGHRSRR